MKPLAVLVLGVFATAAQAQYVDFNQGKFGVTTGYAVDYWESWEDGTSRDGSGKRVVEGLFNVPARETHGTYMAGGGFGSADLVDGTLKAHAWSGSPVSLFDAEENRAYTGYSQSYAWASMWDTVTIGGGVPDGRIPIRLEIDGFSSPEGVISATMFVQPKGTLQQDFSKWISSGAKGFDGTFELDSELLTPLVPTEYEVILTLSAFAPPASFADFSHTARFKWDLSEGVTFTSASGVFNPGRINPVPEPGTFVALGLGALGFLRRRNRSSR